MEQQTIQRLNDLSDQIGYLYRPLKSSNYTAPNNLSLEKECFLKAYAEDKCYNPQFTYPIPPSGWDIPLKEFLAELRPNETYWDHLIYRGVQSTASKLEAIETHDSQKLTQASLDLYGEVSEDLVQLAYDTLHIISSEETVRTISAEAMAKTMREAMDRSGLFDWSVHIKENMNARMSVSALAKEIKINAQKLFSENEVKRLIVHEIGTHVFRSVNGSLQPLKLLARGLHGYLSTEEGLASYHESYYGLKPNSVKRLYALRVIAAHKSISHNFYEIFDELVNYTTFDEAFDIAVRAKRGFSDTREKGGYIKDKVYLEGFLKVSKYLSEYPENYVFLMCGKVAIDGVCALKELLKEENLAQPSFLPSQLFQQNL
jgi:uncharacterized protein (TIGR02421 family)